MTSESPSSSGYVDMTLVTIVTEVGIEARMERDLIEAGARGYTSSVARGEGAHHRRASDIEGGNVRIETVVPDHVADAIMLMLRERYFPRYATVAWLTQVRVVRADEFS